MKKLLLIAFALWGFSAQAQVFEKGQSSYYFGGAFNEELADQYYFLRRQTPSQALHLKYEYGLSSRIGFGISATYFGFSVYPYQFLDSLEIYWRYFPLFEYSQKQTSHFYSVIPKIQFHSKKKFVFYQANPGLYASDLQLPSSTLLDLALALA